MTSVATKHAFGSHLKHVAPASLQDRVAWALEAGCVRAGSWMDKDQARLARRAVTPTDAP